MISLYKKILAIDFETANSSRGSACSVGYALLENDIVISKEILINPEERFDFFNTMIHGITKDMVSDSLLFTEVWKEVVLLIDKDTLVIAHNASFDMSVIRYACTKYDIEFPTFDYCCTLNMSKKVYEKLPSYSLDTIVEYLGLEFNHHKAEDDAVMCLNVYKDIISKFDNSFEKMMEGTSLKVGKIFDGGYTPCGIKKKSKRRVELDLNDIKSTNENFDEDHPFYEKNIVFTGTLDSMPRKDAMQKVVDVGGVLSKGLNKNTNYLVMGIQDVRALKGKEKSSKIVKAESLIEKGNELEIIAEDMFLQMI